MIEPKRKDRERGRREKGEGNFAVFLSVRKRERRRRKRVYFCRFEMDVKGWKASEVGGWGKKCASATKEIKAGNGEKNIDRCTRSSGGREGRKGQNIVFANHCKGRERRGFGRKAPKKQEDKRRKTRLTARVFFLLRTSSVVSTPILIVRSVRSVDCCLLECAPTLPACLLCFSSYMP